MSSRTPRPWFYQEDEYTWQLFGGSGLMPLQLAKCPKKDTPYAEYWPNDADARLISAAPDLLEAAQAMLAALHPEETDRNFDAENRAIWQLEDAVEKAEG